MFLNFSIEQINDGSTFTVEFNNQTAHIDSVNYNFRFQLEHEGDYQLIITQNSAQPFKWYQIFFYCLLGIFQSVFYVIDSDLANKWAEYINPYCIKEKLDLKITESQEFVCIYKNYGVHSFSEMLYENDAVILDKQSDQIENPLDAKHKLFHHIRKIEPLFLLLVVMFLLFGILGFNSGNIVLAVVSLMVLLVMTAVNVLIIFQNYKIYKDIIECVYANSSGDIK